MDHIKIMLKRSCYTLQYEEEGPKASWHWASSSYSSPGGFNVMSYVNSVFGAFNKHFAFADLSQKLVIGDKGIKNTVLMVYSHAPTAQKYRDDKSLHRPEI